MNRCWIVYDDDYIPVGVEWDYWVYEDAVAEYNTLCKKNPKDHVQLFTCYDRDEPNERWVLDKERLP